MKGRAFPFAGKKASHVTGGLSLSSVDKGSVFIISLACPARAFRYRLRPCRQGLISAGTLEAKRGYPGGKFLFRN